MVPDNAGGIGGIVPNIRLRRRVRGGGFVQRARVRGGRARPAGRRGVANIVRRKQQNTHGKKKQTSSCYMECYR